jgi:UDP-N-acetylglucosamine 2-epimerase (non-hydrolysing)
MDKFTNKLIITFGTRPELIKIAPIVLDFRKRGLEDCLILVNTGQHSALLEPLFELFDITPDYSLKIMSKNSNLSLLTARALERLQLLLDEIKENHTICGILAQGDTTSVLATALCAFYNQLPFFHLEAGLRTYNLEQPFPEELNRRVAALCTTVHFAPTQQSVENLLSENIPQQSIHLVGNTIVDALNLIKKSLIKPDILNQKPMVLITCHRRENQGKNLQALIKAVRFLAQKYESVQFVWLMHPNPKVKQPLLDADLESYPNIELKAPIDYLDMIRMLQNTQLLMTDSGGLQEEAPSFNIHTLVLRDFTERPEGIKLGYASLVGCDDAAKIIQEFDEYYPIHRQITQNPYGDGKAAARITDFLVAHHLKVEKKTINKVISN